MFIYTHNANKLLRNCQISAQKWQLKSVASRGFKVWGNIILSLTASAGARAYKGVWGQCPLRDPEAEAFLVLKIFIVLLKCTNFNTLNAIIFLNCLTIIFTVRYVI